MPDGHAEAPPPRSGGPWPRHATFDGAGLAIAGRPAAELAARFGTPLLVVDEGEVRARCREVRDLFPRACYAVKAFTSHAIVRVVLDEGLDLLCATGGELEACLRAGAPGPRIVLHGNAKTDDELARAIEAGVRLVVIDHAAELERLDAAARSAGRVQPALLRVVPQVHVETHEAIATGHDASKFGTPIAEAPEAFRCAAGLHGVRLEGLHAHVGSQILDVAPQGASIDALVGLAVQLRDELGVKIDTLDAGGGFGVTYVDERPPSLRDAASELASRLDRACAAAGLPLPELIVEPGRWIVANAGVTLYRVVATKSAAGRRLLAVDGGMSDNVRPALYDARHAVALATAQGGERAARPDGEAAWTVVGRHCESGDTLAEDVMLPAGTGPGDLLAFAATGAYTYSLASTYNRVGRPAVVAVRDGAATTWLRREDAADLDRLEAGIARVPAEPPSIAGVVVRPADQRDAVAYLAFWTAIVEEGRHVRTERVTTNVRGVRRRFRTPITEREAQIVAVDDAGAVLGHLYIEREAHPVTRHVASLGVAVAAEARGRGIGTALMSEAFTWARSVGVDKIALSVYPHNLAAIALYRRFGFVEEGRLARHSRKSYGEEDEILMAAWIDEPPRET